MQWERVKIKQPTDKERGINRQPDYNKHSSLLYSDSCGQLEACTFGLGERCQPPCPPLVGS
ncbi:MAG: hypothetical protein LDL41_19880 [Coleofasciculus sp. S288]|nr:hypothetical protein [Coleofasciculus sp. S288]